MKPKFKTVHRSFNYLHCDDFAQYLESMAAKGWHLDSWGAGLKFRRGEPEQATYAVEVFTDASEYDTRPELHTKEFAEYCEAAGWQLIDAKRKFVIFKKIRPDAIPIMTDQERLSAAVKEDQQINHRTLFTASVWVVMQWWQFLGSSFEKIAFSPMQLLILLGWTALFLGSLSSVLRVLWLKHSWRKRIAGGQMLYLGRAGGFIGRGYELALIPVMAVWFGAMVFYNQWSTIIYLLIFLGILRGVLFLVDKFRPDSVTNQIIMNVLPIAMFVMLFLFLLGSMFSGNQMEKSQTIPDWYQELDFVDEPAYVHLEEDSSIFGSAIIVREHHDDAPSVYCGVFESEYDWVIDKVWKNRTKADNWEPCTQDWGGEEVMTRFGSCYVVRYPNHVLYYYGTSGEPLTEDQISLIKQTLIHQ
ncbi:MAG: DUF2812 domain-containing protein [Oscillospiraceae bacterium]|nr:DUF2812 domain-containing protein [Oscillospiraceae bacterium]MBR2889679.1 DUF2812 domain-containing protein [Oscillospiraceae bacterium]